MSLTEFIIGMLLVICTGIFSWLATQQIVDAHEWVAHTFEVETVLSRLERQTRDAEEIEKPLTSGDRQGMFTSFVVAAISADKNLLLRLTSDNQIQQERLKVITDLLTQPREVTTFQQIRAVLYTMHDEEEQLLNRRTEQVSNEFSSALWFLLIGKVVALGLLILSFSHHRAEIKRRKAAEEVLQVANESLSLQVQALKVIN